MAQTRCWCDDGSWWPIGCPRAWLTELGAHRLRDLDYRSEGFQLAIPIWSYWFCRCDAPESLGLGVFRASDQLHRPRAGTGRVVVLDTCEHLLDASAALIVAVLGASPGLTLVATSREPIGVPGELSWRVPSLSLADEAVELFADRARHARPDLAVGSDDVAAVVEICARLDGLPLAIELAAARVRALSLAEILDGLHDRFRLLTGGARTAVRRHQTLRALVDWSHALLTDSERVLFQFRRVRWCCPVTSRTSTGSTPTTGIRCRRLQGPQRHRTRLQRRQATARPSHPLRQPGHRLPRSRRPTNHHHSCSGRKI